MGVAASARHPEMLATFGQRRVTLGATKRTPCSCAEFTGRGWLVVARSYTGWTVASGGRVCHALSTTSHVNALQDLQIVAVEGSFG